MQRPRQRRPRLRRPRLRRWRRRRRWEEPQCKTLTDI